MGGMTDETVYGNAGVAGLRQALNFTDADLVENRAGRMSATQNARMTKGQAQSRVATIVVSIIFVALLVVIAIVVLPPSLAPQPATSSAVPPWIIGLVILVVAGIMAISFLRTRRGIRGLTGALLSVEGEANPKISSFGDANTDSIDTMYRVRIGSVNFPLHDASQVNAFEKGRRYRAYYVKSTLPVILAAEPLDS
jgi:hypothetical protein